MEAGDGKEETPLSSALSRFQLSEDYGFLLPNPLVGDGRATVPVGCRKQQGNGGAGDVWMPQLSTRHLRGREELYLAHLVLSFITMGYLWQEGEEGTVKVTAGSPARGECHRPSGSPPILSHADFVLANWRRKDPSGCCCPPCRNLDPIISLPGGESLRGFILVTFLVEKAAVPGIKVGREPPAVPLPRAHPSPSIALCSPSAPPPCAWLSWKDNPAMPDGLVYEGVSEEPMAFSGGSAAQSTVLHAFDELLGIRHSQESTAFLHRMRDYMPPPHRAFIEEIGRAPSLKQHVLCSGDARLRAAFNRCITALADFRSCHIAIVTKYIAVAKAKAGRAEVGGWAGRPPAALEAKGTGGSHIFSFLKSVRDTTRDGLISA
uniref:Indoleamine 2,3-dioxygenase 2 n=1 Tax=Anas platyrhynchos platyrhynchos TaxID=8840 RepID=A0A493TR63_ANAPP